MVKGTPQGVSGACRAGTEPCRTGAVHGTGRDAAHAPHDARTPLHQIVFAGTAAGLLLFFAAVFAIWALLPAQGETDPGKAYNYEYSSAKSASVDFNTAGAAEDSMLLFGSSELATSSDTVAQVPANVFGSYDFGVNLNYVGEAFDQSLWHAIATGAYSGKTARKKVAIIVSPTWFADGGLDSDTFKSRFSYQLYRQFCANEQISEESKEYAARRLQQQGVDDMTVCAGRRKTPRDVVNDCVLGAVDDLKLRYSLGEVRSRGIERASVEGGTRGQVKGAVSSGGAASSDTMASAGAAASSEGAPSAAGGVAAGSGPVSTQEAAPLFDELREQAVSDAEAATTSNDWGIDDAFYRKNIEGRTELLRDSHADETYSDTREYDDLAFFLKVCRETGLEPMVVISPVHGEFFDLEGIDRSVRERCYERVRAICGQAGVSVAGFSSREYERYFLHDIVHFGWTGWLDVEEALVGFAREGEGNG